MQRYREIFSRRRWVLAITVLAALVVGIVGALLAEPVYTATAVLRFTPRSASTDYATLEYAVRLKNTYAELAVSGPSIQLIESRLGRDFSDDNLRQAISVEFPSNNELVNVVVRYSDPVVAADIANTVSGILIEQSQVSRSGRLFTLEVLEQAVPPPGSSLIYSLIPIAFGVLLSLIAGIGLIFLLESLDTRVYTARQLEDIARMPVLIQVPTIRGRKDAYLPGEGTGEVEPFRHLRTLLSVRGRSGPLKLIAITSAAPGEGKSIVAANLARSFAMLGLRVVLVDCDLRRPKLHEIFRLPNEVGLSKVLRREAELDAAISHVAGYQLFTLTSGPLPPNPAELLGSAQATELWQQLAERFDVVLLDTPALLAVTDAALLATQADGVLFVARYALSQSENVRTAYAQLDAVGAKVIGIVANGAGQNPVYQYYKA